MANSSRFVHLGPAVALADLEWRPPLLVEPPAQQRHGAAGGQRRSGGQRRGTPEEPSLPEGRTEPPGLLEVLGGLEPLGEDPGAGARRPRVDRAQAAEDLLRRLTPHEMHVQLDDLGRHEGQEGQRAGVGAHVVQGDGRPLPAQGHHRLEELGGLEGELALGDLEDQPWPGGGQRGPAPVVDRLRLHVQP